MGKEEKEKTRSQFSVLGNPKTEGLGLPEIVGLPLLSRLRRVPHNG
jgi:hypothetical protein